VPLLAEFFLQQAIEREGEVKRLTPAVIAEFRSYSWPGNVRELRNAVYRSYVMAAGPEIQESWLSVRESGSRRPRRGRVRQLKYGWEPARRRRAPPDPAA
jgi:DNA-binding NtrC family response regulator